MRATSRSVIRDLNPEDLDGLLALYGHLHEGDAIPSRGEVEDVWQEIQSNPRIAYYGGFDSDTLVSSCTLAIIPNLTRACRPYGLIENVVTHAAHRSQGWGTAVLRHALEQAWRQSCYKVMLLTGRTDDATLRFYAKAGFDGATKRGFIVRPGA